MHYDGIIRKLTILNRHSHTAYWSVDLALAKITEPYVAFYFQSREQQEIEKVQKVKFLRNDAGIPVFESLQEIMKIC